jgi:hypothetical protein
MIMQTIVIDDDGRAWDARSSVLRHRLCCPAPDFDLPAYLVENLGFALVTLFGSGAARLRMRFDKVAPASIAAAIHLVADLGFERIVVSHSGASFIDRLFPSVAQAVAYIDEQICERHWQAAANVSSRRLPIGTLADDTGPLSTLLARWRGIRRHADLVRLKESFCAASAARFIALESVAGRLTITDLSSGFESFGKTWRENALGMPVTEQPDHHYGRWVQGMYESVLQTRQPRLDDVEATIRRPHLGDSIRMSYRRLILPFRQGRTGRIRLIGASLVKQSSRLSGPGCV